MGERLTNRPQPTPNQPRGSLGSTDPVNPQPSLDGGVGVGCLSPVPTTNRPRVREDSQAKTRRLVSEGRVTIRRIRDDLIGADVRGDSAEVYAVTWEPGGWSCSCPALGRCSHVRAVQLVTLTHNLEPA
jgi:hypothetical protein